VPGTRLSLRHDSTHRRAVHRLHLAPPPRLRARHYCLLLLPATPAHCLLPAAHFLLPTAWWIYLLPAARCLLPAACCPLPAARCLLPTACCPLPAARCLLPVAQYLLPAACCPTACYLLQMGGAHLRPWAPPYSTRSARPLWSVQSALRVPPLNPAGCAVRSIGNRVNAGDGTTCMPACPHCLSSLTVLPASQLALPLHLNSRAGALRRWRRLETRARRHV
jgi:hypothetical protein